MTDIVVNPTCINCGVCVKICPMRIFVLTDNATHPQPCHTETCVCCGHCLANCPVNAINIKSLCLESDVNNESHCTYNDLCSVVRHRRSVRLFLDKTIPKADFEELLDVARFAPTARNSQGVSLTIIMGPQKVQKLSGLTIDWFRQKQDMMLIQQWESGYDIINRHAPHLVIAHSDDSTAKPVEDAVIAMTTFELLAAAKGFGTCWAGFFMTAAYEYEPLHKALELPLDHKVRAALMIGYSAVKPQRIPKRNFANVKFL